MYRAIAQTSPDNFQNDTQRRQFFNLVIRGLEIRKAKKLPQDVGKTDSQLESMCHEHISYIHRYSDFDDLGKSAHELFADMK